MRDCSKILHFLVVIFLFTSLIVFWGCSDDDDDPSDHVACPELGATPTNASDWVSFVNWDEAEEITVNFVENGSDDFTFEPRNLSMEVNKAYKLKLQNPAGNASKHYYTAGEFYQTCVTRKAEDSKAEIKVPYFKAVELLIGGTTELFILPTVVGNYDVVCTISGHEDAGMHGTITVSP